MESQSLLDELVPLFDVAPLTWVALCACLISGGIIGLERQLRGKPVGIRTSVLICLGTYVFMAMGLAAATENTDPTRVLGQIVTGVGFIGAGVMLTRDGAVIGATSAADIWLLAAIGVVIAVQSPGLGIKLSLLSVVTLVGVNYVETRLKRRRSSALETLTRALSKKPAPAPPEGGE